MQTQIPDSIIPILTFPIAVLLTIVLWKFVWWLLGKILPKRYQ